MTAIAGCAELARQPSHGDPTNPTALATLEGRSLQRLAQNAAVSPPRSGGVAPVAGTMAAAPNALSRSAGASPAIGPTTPRRRDWRATLLDATAQATPPALAGPSLAPPPPDGFDDGQATPGDPPVTESATPLSPESLALLSLEVSQPLFATPHAGVVRLSLAETLRRALAASHVIKTAAFGPAIAATDILEAQGAFDTLFFLRGDGNSEISGSPILYRNRDQPLGQPFGFGGVAAGGGERITGLESREFAWRLGFTQRLTTGAEVTIAQRFSHIESNNPFLQPNPQSTANLGVSIRQPLLRGAGLDTNRGPIFIGLNNREIGIQRFRRAVIDHLVEVETAYWNLRLSRLSLAVGERLLDQQSQTSRILQQRQRDVLPYARDRAAAAVAAAEANVIAARVTVRNNQDRLKVLLNDAQLPLGREIEIIPDDPAIEAMTATDQTVIDAALRTALTNRPDILSARLEIRNAAVAEGLARNELLPRLDVIAETLPQGLQGQVSTAFRDQWRFQFQDWLFGLVLEIPLGNRTARARFRRQQLTREQLVESLSNTIQTAYFDVTTAVRALENAQGQLPARQRGLRAAANELVARQVQTLQGNPREGLPAALDLLLSSQERLATAATALYQTQAEYAIAIARLEQAKGTLLYYNNVTVVQEAPVMAEPVWFFEPRDILPPALPPDP